MINNRLYSLAEESDWLADEQAGFQKQRLCEDQVLRLVHHVSDGFQDNPAKRTVMALFDYNMHTIELGGNY